MKRAVNRGFINYDGDLEGNISIYKNDPSYATVAHLFHDIDEMRADIEFFLDAQRDFLPGCMEDMLHLSQWAEWFKDGTAGKSPYSNWFLYILRFHPECAKKYDPGLSKLLNRFKIMVYPPLSQPTLLKTSYLTHTWDMDMYHPHRRPRTPLYHFYAAFMDWRFCRWKSIGCLG